METLTTNSKNLKKIALIGAGLSNLTFLYSLKAMDNIQVKLFERSKVHSGRAATRIRDEYYFDNGANYFNISDPKISQIILRELSTENLVEIKKWIFPFDKDFKINFDENLALNHNQKIKYTYLNGVRNLGDLLLKNSQVKYEIQFSKNVTKIKRNSESNSWTIYSEDENLGEFDYIVFGVPAPNIARVFMNSTFNENEKTFFKKSTEILLNNTYKKIFSLAIAFSKKEISESEEIFYKFFALINSDRKNPISWVCIENEKNRAYLDSNDDLLLVVQMSDEFSTQHQNLEKEKAFKIILENFFKLFPSLQNKNVKFHDLKFWGHALPNEKLSESLIKELGERNIYVIGDCTVGKGRVDEAMLTGVNLYEQLFAKF
jgi:predicted NAD/FAD-dependent oxidoreductase